MGDARRFLVAFTIVTLIFVLPTAAVGARLAALGEIVLVPDTRATATLQGQLFADRAIPKVSATRAREPEVLVLGSSRVGEFRSLMFAGCEARTSCFYNATGVMATIKQVPADPVELECAYEAGPVLKVEAIGVGHLSVDRHFIGP